MGSNSQAFLEELMNRFVAGGLNANATDSPLRIQVGREVVYKGTIGQEPEINKLTPSRIQLLQSVIEYADASVRHQAHINFQAIYQFIQEQPISEVYDQYGDGLIEAYEAVHGKNSFEYPDHSEKTVHDFCWDLGIDLTAKLEPVESKGVINIDLGGDRLFRYNKEGEIEIDLFNPQIAYEPLPQMPQAPQQMEESQPAVTTREVREQILDYFVTQVHPGYRAGIADIVEHCQVDHDAVLLGLEDLEQSGILAVHREVDESEVIISANVIDGVDLERVRAKEETTKEVLQEDDRDDRQDPPEPPSSSAMSLDSAVIEQVQGYTQKVGEFAESIFQEYGQQCVDLFAKYEFSLLDRAAVDEMEGFVTIVLKEKGLALNSTDFPDLKLPENDLVQGVAWGLLERSQQQHRLEQEQQVESVEPTLEPTTQPFWASESDRQDRLAKLKADATVEPKPAPTENVYSDPVKKLRQGLETLPAMATEAKATVAKVPAMAVAMVELHDQLKEPAREWFNKTFQQVANSDLTTEIKTKGAEAARQAMTQVSSLSKATKERALVDSVVALTKEFGELVTYPPSSKSGKGTQQFIYETEQYRIQVKGTNQYSVSDREGKEILAFRHSGVNVKVTHNALSSYQEFDLIRAGGQLTAAKAAQGMKNAATKLQHVANTLGNLAPQGTKEKLQEVGSQQVAALMQMVMKDRNGKTFEGEKFQVSQDNGTVRLTAKDGRGEILQADSNTVRSRMNGQDISRLQQFGQAFVQKLSTATKQATSIGR
jgi:hypothetical protein